MHRKNTIPHIKYLVLSLFFLVLLNSCKSLKNNVPVATEVIPIDSIYQTIFDPPLIDWIDARAKVKVSSPQRTDKFVMFLRMKSDSIIWASFKKFGAEGGRVLITQDSVYAINRIEKSYQILSLKMLNSFGFTASLNDLQALLKAQLPPLDTSALWKANEDESFYNFRSMKNDVVFDFSFEKISGHLKKGQFVDRFNLNGYWDYDDYRTVNDISIPFFRKFKTEFGINNYFEITLEFTDIEINKANTTRFSIPSHYKKME